MLYKINSNEIRGFHLLRAEPPGRHPRLD